MIIDIEVECDATHHESDDNAVWVVHAGELCCTPAGIFFWCNYCLVDALEDQAFSCGECDSDDVYRNPIKKYLPI